MSAAHDAARRREILSNLSKLAVDRNHHKCVVEKTLVIRRQMNNKLIGDKMVPGAARDVIASHLALEDQGIHVNIEDVTRLSTCKNRRNYEEAKRSARNAIGSSINLKQKNSVYSLAVVSNMVKFLSGAKVLLARLEEHGQLEGKSKGYYDTSRYHAGALWLEALRSGEKNLHKKSKSQLQNQAGGLTSRELDNIAAFIASASDLQENTFIAEALGESISSIAPVPISTLKKRKGGGKLIRHSPKSIKIDENGGRSILSSDEEAKQQQRAVMLECKRALDHNDYLIIPSSSVEGNIDNERTATMKSMIRDTKVILRILPSRDREKLVQLHVEALSQAG